eukprot:145297-Pyramimonas_sp.AAC.1
MGGDFFQPKDRCGNCGCWHMRQDVSNCIACRRLGSAWATDTDSSTTTELEAPKHPLDLLGTRLTFQLAR